MEGRKERLRARAPVGRDEVAGAAGVLGARDNADGDDNGDLGDESGILIPQ